MSGLLPVTGRVSRRASRRGAALALLDRAGIWLGIAGAAGVAGVGAWKLVPQLRAIPWWAVLALPLLAAMLAAVIASLARRWSPVRAARELDDRLGLRDRLSSALELNGVAPDDPFVALAIRDAERLSGAVDVRRALPFHWRPTWSVWPALLAAGIAIGIFAPARSTDLGRADRKSQQAAAKSAADQLSAIGDGVRQAAEAGELDARTTRDLEDFARIEQELAEGRSTPEQARAQAALRLEELATQVQTRAQAQQAAADHARRAIAESARNPADAGSLWAPPAEDPDFRRRLSEGDLDSAAAAARKLARDAENMPDAERRALARDLDEIARNLDARRKEVTSDTDNRPADAAPDGDAPADSEGSPKPVLTEKPDNSGESSKPETGTETPKPAPQKPASDDAGTEPPGNPDAGSDQAKHPSPDPKAPRNAEDSPPPDPGESKRSDPETPMDRLSQALRKAAEDLKQPAGSKENQPPASQAPTPDPDAARSQPPEQGPGADRPQARQESPQKEQDQSAPQPGTQQRPSEATDRKEQPGSKPNDSRRPTPSDKGTKSSETSPQPKPAGQTEPGATKTAPKDSSNPSSAKGESEKPVPQPGDQNQPTSPSPGPGASQAPQQSPAPQAPSHPAKDQSTPAGPEDRRSSKEGPTDHGAGKQPASDGPDPAPDSRNTPPLERLARELQKLDQSGKNARENQELAKRFQQQARKLLENASPEELRELGEAARRHGSGGHPGDGPRERAGPGQPRAWDGTSELVDARGTPDPTGDSQDRVISESPGSPGPTARSENSQVSGQAVRQAAAGAQRAVEQQSVPPQYGPFVKRVFKRFVERAGPEKAASPSRTPDAPDAVRKH